MGSPFENKKAWQKEEKRRQGKLAKFGSKEAKAARGKDRDMASGLSKRKIQAEMREFSFGALGFGPTHVHFWHMLGC